MLAGPGEADPASAGRIERFFGLRRQHGRQKAVPAAWDAGQAGGIAEVPVWPHAGRPGIFLGRLAGIGFGASGGRRPDAAAGGVWRQFRRNLSVLRQQME